LPLLLAARRRKKLRLRLLSRLLRQLRLSPHRLR
jgi:hypothetical protein